MLMKCMWQSFFKTISFNGDVTNDVCCTNCLTMPDVWRCIRGMVIYISNKQSPSLAHCMVSVLNIMCYWLLLNLLTLYSPVICSDITPNVVQSCNLLWYYTERWSPVICYDITPTSPNVAIECLARLHIEQFPGSNSNTDTGIHTEDFRGSLQSLLAYANKAPRLRPHSSYSSVRNATT